MFKFWSSIENWQDKCSLKPYNKWFGVQHEWKKLVGNLANNLPSDLDYKIIPSSNQAVANYSNIPLYIPNEESLKTIVMKRKLILM